MDMSLEEKTKKIRISKFAAEYNLSSDAIVEHLKKKGFKVNSINTPLTDEMLAELNYAFKKDIDKALAQKRKIDELNKIRESEEKIDSKDTQVVAEKGVSEEIISQKQKEEVLEREVSLPEEASKGEEVVVEKSESPAATATDDKVEQKMAAEVLERESHHIEGIKAERETKEESKLTLIEQEEAEKIKEYKEETTEGEYSKNIKVEQEEEQNQVETSLQEVSETASSVEETYEKDLQEEKVIAESSIVVEPKSSRIIAPFDDLVEEAEAQISKENLAQSFETKKEEVYKTETELEIQNRKLKILGKIELPEEDKGSGRRDSKGYFKDKKKPEERKEEKKFDRDKREKERDRDKDRDKEGKKFERKPFGKPVKEGAQEKSDKEKKFGDKKKFFDNKKFDAQKQREPIKYNRDRKDAIDPEIAVLSEYYEEDLNISPEETVVEESEVKEIFFDEEEEKKDKKKKKKDKNKQSELKGGEFGKKKKTKRIEVDKTAVKEAIKRTLLSMDDSAVTERAALRKKKKKEKAAELEKQLEEQERESKILKVTEFVSVMELANLMKVDVSEVIQKCISLGLMVSINQRLDVETITLVADEFGFQVEFQEEFIVDELADEPDPPEKLKPRPPVVTVMGHVDHGKTSLLDRIRQTNVVAGEAGGITQHIGAYQVKLPNGKSITFLDTPGHEAFTAMRARGAKVTDIVVLVVAADDAVMPQTIEAINHAQAAGAPIVIAINKIDKPGANIDKIKQQLAERNILVEDWGGKYQYAEISAKLGKNIDVLLDKILLEAELLDLKANPDRPARGTVIEAKMDKGKGIMATILVQKGTLKIGDSFVCGIAYGRVRAMYDERDNRVESAGPSTPIVVTGFEEMPQAGDTFVVVDSERKAREIALKRQQIKRQQDAKQTRHITLDEIAKQVAMGGVKELPLIIKGDVDGSIEAISDALLKLSNEEVKVNIIHKAVGAISESDVLLASASGAIIIGFNVRPNMNARKLAETEKIDIRLYNVIYDAINEVKSALEGMLSPVISEEIIGSAEVREVFKVPKVGTVAGCYVVEGKVARTAKARVIRNGVVVYDGEIGSLKRFKDDAREVEQGYECGIGIAGFNDIKVGDIIEAYKLIETKKKL